MEEQETQVMQVQTNPAPEEEGLTLQKIFYIIKKHLIAILVFIAVGIVGGILYNRLTKPVYGATRKLLITYTNESTGEKTTYSSSDSAFLLSIAETITTLVKEDVVMEDAAAQLNEMGYEKVTYKSLAGSLSTSTKNAIVYIDCKNEDPQLVVDSLNATVASFDAFINAGSIDPSTGEWKYTFKLYGGNVEAVDTVTYFKASLVNNAPKHLAIGALIGLGAAFIYVVAREMTDNHFKNSDQIERELGLPVLSAIPFYELPEENVVNTTHVSTSSIGSASVTTSPSKPVSSVASKNVVSDTPKVTNKDSGKATIKVEKTTTVTTSKKVAPAKKAINKKPTSKTTSKGGTK